VASRGRRVLSALPRPRVYGNALRGARDAVSRHRCTRDGAVYNAASIGARSWTRWARRASGCCART